MFKEILASLVQKGLEEIVDIIEAGADKGTKSNVVSALRAARKQYEAGKITKEQYEETLEILHDEMPMEDYKEINKLLDEQYSLAEATVDTHNDIIDEMNDLGATSLLDFIENFPSDAYIHGVIYGGPSLWNRERIPTKEAKLLLDEYMKGLEAEKQYILDEVKMLGGDERDILNEFKRLVF